MSASLRIFITGGTGFIGFAVAVALRQRGHHVTTLVREASLASPAAAALRQHEIHIVVGSTTDSPAPAALSVDALQAFDVLISAAQSVPAAPGSEATIAAFTAAAAASSSPKTVIYTSGCLLYGDRRDSHDAPLSEDASLDACHSAIQWRIGHEQRVLTAANAHGIVLRPGFVYGRSGSYVGAFFAAATKGEQIVAGDGTNHWSTVHIDDLARAYVLIAEAGSSVAGRIFNVADEAFPTTNQLATAGSAASGFTGPITYKPASDSVWFTLASHSAKLNSAAIRQALGWRPLMPAFLDDLDTYYHAWQAYGPASGAAHQIRFE